MMGCGSERGHKNTVKTEAHARETSSKTTAGWTECALYR